MKQWVFDICVHTNWGLGLNPFEGTSLSGRVSIVSERWLLVGLGVAQAAGFLFAMEGS